MLEAAVIVARLLQYAGAAVLFGSPLFFVYALPRGAEVTGARPLVAGAAAALALASLLGLAAQASLLVGSFAEGLTITAIGDVVSYLDLGKAALVRALAAILALMLLFAVPPGRGRWLAAAGCGAIAAASIAWMGHAAAGEGHLGAAHLLSDILHALTATTWLGALAGLLLLLAARAMPARDQILYRALRRFSAVGPAIVGLLVLSGLGNAWVLVGWDQVFPLWRTPYGRLLILKLALFAAMFALAVVNRYRLTPRLESDLTASRVEPATIARLRRSIGFESALGLGVLAVVAWLGTLAPPAAG